MEDSSGCFAYDVKRPLHQRRMYLLIIRDGLQTRHIGPYASPKQAADDLDRLLPLCSDRARWQIHALESPDQLLASMGQSKLPLARGEKQKSVVGAA
jgi:hypothetical protein